MSAERHPQEAARLEALRSYAALDTASEEAFEDLVGLAAEICGTPISLISLIDENRQWFKAATGTDLKETARGDSICAHTILEKGLFEVRDTTQHPIFRANPYVAGEPGLRFYAGVPLETPQGLPIGTLCVLDTVPRELTPGQRKALGVLAREVMAQLELRRKVREAEGAQIDARAAANFVSLVMDSLPMRVAYVDRQFTYRFVNGAYEKELGLRREDLIGRPVAEVLGPAVLEAARPLLERAFKGESFEIVHEVPYPSGTQWIRAIYVPDRSASGEVRGVVCHVQNVTDRQATERALSESEERFRQLVDLAPATVWVGELDGGLSFISQDFYDATGMTPEESMPHGWASVVHPEDLPRVAAAWEKSRADETPYDTEFRIRMRDGEYRWISARALPMRNADGMVTGWLGSNSDIHERKAAEEVLRQAVALRTVELEDAVREAEGFNYSISHDLRAPVRAIASTSGILLEEAGVLLDPEHRELLARQATNANRLGVLIDELLRLSRLSRVEVKREKIDLTEKVQSIVGEIASSECEFEIQAGMWVEADPGLLRTILENLIGNAVKFSPAGGTVSVGMTDDVIWVRDEGIGLDMKYAPKIFLPFERLVHESEFVGTGIGLANVKRIVERHGGKVWVESEEGRGSTFFFTLGRSG
jgi:PAS domain S-box-containing protein